MFFNPAQLVSMLGGMQNINQQLNTFGNNFRNQYGQNADPEAIGRELLNSGKIDQQKFEQFRQVANMLTGRNL